MKKCFLSFALLFLSFSSYSLPVMKTVETSDLYKVNSEDSGFDQFIKGKLTMNYKEKMISVYLLGKNTCPPNVMCVAGPRTELLEAPITNRSVDTCGVVAYTAKENKLPVDACNGSQCSRSCWFSSCCRCRFRNFRKMKQNKHNKTYRRQKCQKS